MPVTFNPADILTPDGKLEASWFTGKSVDAVIQMISGFVDDVLPQLTALEGDDDNQYAAIENWAYAQSYLWLKADYGSRTGTITLAGEITAQNTREAADIFGELAAQYLAAFYVLVPDARPVSTKPRSYSFTAKFRF